ncbi:MAG: hypothetical protein P1U32_07010 [Legionellaceae bacterium]|nr:hypothetical protein [Legionellaceae bacterium]
MQQLKTLVFGLSGNPPTKNHLLFIQHLLTLEGYDLVRVILSAQSPLKPLQDYIPPEARFKMLNAMLEVAGVDWRRCVLERLELDRPPPSYMKETLRALIERARKADIEEHITLVLGLDALNTLTDWYAWQDLGALCEIQFYPRGDVVMPQSAIYEKLQVLQDAGIQASVVTRETDMVAGSATHARLYYAAGKSGIPQGITPEVDQLIRAKGYYGASSC